MRDLVVIGLGQLGRLFAGGALARGFRVTPVVRGTDPGPALAALPSVPILVTVGERDLAPVLAGLPAARRGDAILVQNELFPADWAAMTPAPTVAVVWLNAKPGRPVEVARPTAVHGRHAPVVCDLHGPLAVPCRVLPDADALGGELVAKYALIVAVNALGVAGDATVGAWLARDEPLVRELVRDGVRLGEARLGRPVDGEWATTAVVEALRALAAMPARGRSARERVERAVRAAQALGIRVPAVESIAQGHPAPIVRAIRPDEA